MPETNYINDAAPNLQKPNIFMKNHENVRKKIEKIQKDGADKLQIVTDFDLTVTKQHVEGRHVLSSFGIFWKCKQLPSSMVTIAGQMYDKYRPMELNPHLPLNEKIDGMESWMHDTEDMLRGIDFDSSELDEVSKIYGTSVRDGTHELFRRLEQANVPILVFSAGLGDVVEAVLKNHEIHLKNVKIISNFWSYNDGKIDGFKNKKLIHVFNKNESALDHDYFNVLEGRNNVVLMGDMTGDASMADGIKETETILKIGFLYDEKEKVEQRLPSYLEAFDIVLVDDQTMNVASDILMPIL